MTGARIARRPRAALVALGVVALLAAAWVRMGPLPEGLLVSDRYVSTEYVDRGGEPLYHSLSALGGRQRALDPERLPQNLVHATLAAEDARFFSHPGVDPLAIARAMLHNLRAGRLREGGSTLTQQTVKVLTERERSLRGKLGELVLALRLEHRLGKRAILALYLSVAPYGNQLFGAEAASRAYFGCSAQDLTPAQAALLAGLPQRPGALNPYRKPERALARQRWVLARMRALGYLDDAALAAARRERLKFVRDPSAFLAPHFVEMVRGQLAKGLPPRRVETSLDASLQRQVQGILRMHRERLERHGAHSVAVAVLDNASGDWLAWEGSGDYLDARHGGAIDGVLAPRQPGSTLKPFTYALAFERGYTPASVLPDVPQHFATAKQGVVYSPRNYDGVFRGPLRSRQALAGSENVPAVHLLSQVGVPDLLRLLRRSGFETLDKTADYYGYALTMGDAEVRLAELVAAYATLARGGVYLEPRCVRRIVQSDGTQARSGPGAGRRVLSTRSAYWVSDVLSDARARAFVFGSGGSLDFPFPVAVKTGTSQAYRDNWTLGFTREVSVGVWVGNFDRAPLLASSGVTGAAPIFHDVMVAAQRRALGRLPAETDPPPVARPDGLVLRSVCRLSGLLATPACPSVESEWLPPRGSPPACAWHRMRGGRSEVVWPPEYRTWARELGLLDHPRPAPGVRAPRVRAASRADVQELRISNPPEGATYWIDPTLRPGFQTLALRAVAPSNDAHLEWEVDGHGLGRCPPDRALDWPLTPGRHHVVVSDERGRRAEALILVK